MVTFSFVPLGWVIYKPSTACPTGSAGVQPSSSDPGGRDDTVGEMPDFIGESIVLVAASPCGCPFPCLANVSQSTINVATCLKPERLRSGCEATLVAWRAIWEGRHRGLPLQNARVIVSLNQGALSDVADLPVPPIASETWTAALW